LAQIKSKKILIFDKCHSGSSHRGYNRYLLNAITLLSEAVGLYTKEIFKEINPDVKSFIEEFENKVKQHKHNNSKYHLYSLSSQSKTLYKLNSGFNGNFLKITKSPNDNWKMWKGIYKMCLIGLR